MNKKEIDKPKSNCAIFGIYNHPEASLMTYYGLHALQHRGQEASGICSSEFLPDRHKYRFNIYKGHGIVMDVFHEPEILPGCSITGMFPWRDGCTRSDR